MLAIVKKPPPPRLPLRRRRSWAWLRLLRPLAAAAGAATAVAFAFILEDGSPVWHEALRVGLLTAAVLACAAVLNDLLDQQHDAAVHPWRPLPAGLVPPHQATGLALALAAAALALAASLGWRPLLIALAALALAYLYHARLKATPFSWLPLALAFALLPLGVADAVDRFHDDLWWALPVGLSGGFTAYLALKLPDYERDDAANARNLLHWATIDYALPLAWGAMGVYIVIAVASANIENLRVEWLAPPAALAILLTLAMMGVLFTRVTERRLLVQRWLFSAAVVALALGWLGSIVP